MTVFGLPYVELFSRDKLLASPVHKTYELADGSIVLQLTSSLEDAYRGEAAFEQQRQLVRNHLNSDAFYDPVRGPEGNYRVANFTWGASLQ